LREAGRKSATPTVGRKPSFLSLGFYKSQILSLPS
jgi:hypothetical protein